MLVLSFGRHVFAACTPGTNWTAAWTDSYGQTAYTLEAPCKVYIGIPFNIVATVTDASYPDSDVAFLWSIRDNGSVVLGGGFNWLTTVSGQWQQTIVTTYTGTPIDHLLEFKFNDLGQGSGAHYWSQNLIGEVTVDPYPNVAPVADAGPDIIIAGADQHATTLKGQVSDGDGNPLSYRWLDGDRVLKPSTPADPSGNASLDLGTLSRLDAGSHIFTLEVTDGTDTATDTVVVSVENSRPVVAPFAGGTYQAGNALTLTASVSDYEGDTVSFRWLEGATVLAEGSAGTLAGGAPVQLPLVFLSTGLPVGTHALTLEVKDGVNLVSAQTVATVIDTQAPVLAPVSSTNLLWPPDGRMTEVLITANARDNSGGSILLSVSVSTSTKQTKGTQNNQAPDYTITGIDQAAGVIALQLRNTRGSDALVYSIDVTATDAYGNASTSTVMIKSTGTPVVRGRKGKP